MNKINTRTRFLSLLGLVFFSLSNSFLITTPSAAESHVGEPHCAADAEARCFYIAPNGDDDDAGTLDFPYRTFQMALKQAGPGDFIYARGGTYGLDNSVISGLSRFYDTFTPPCADGLTETDGYCFVPKRVFASIADWNGWPAHYEHSYSIAAGEPDRPITLRNFPGEKPVLNVLALRRADDIEAAFPMGQHPAVIMRKSHWVIRGFEIIGGSINLRGNIQDLTIEHNDIHSLVTDGGDNPGLIRINRGPEQVRILNNRLHDLYDSEQPGEWQNVSDAQHFGAVTTLSGETYGGTDDTGTIEIRGNTIFNMPQAFFFKNAALGPINIIDNHIYDSGRIGGNVSSNVTFKGNLVHGVKAGVWRQGQGFTESSALSPEAREIVLARDGQNLTIEYNTIVGLEGSLVGSSYGEGHMFSNNLIMGLSDTAATAGYNSTSFIKVREDFFNIPTADSRLHTFSSDNNCFVVADEGFQMVARYQRSPNLVENYDLTQARDIFNLDLNSTLVIEADPTAVFENPSSGNYSLKSSIDCGQPVGHTVLFPETPTPSFSCDNAPVGTIFCDDFESGNLDARYFETSSKLAVDNVGRGGSKGVRVSFKEGVSDAGSLKKSFGTTPDSYIGNPALNSDIKYDDIYWRIDLRTQPGWQGGGGDKLSRITTLANSNWAQGAMGHIWSSGNYLVMDPASGIDVDGNLVSTQYNDFDNLRWLGSKGGNIDLFSTANSGQWFCIEAHVKLNTPDNNDGLFEFWIDDTLQASTTDLNWHGGWNADPDNLKLNAVMIENYWNAGSPVDQERYMDNFVISTNRIGCDAGETNTPDTTAPVITLVSTNTVELINGMAYTDPGASALDAVDGVVAVVTSGAVNTDVPGTYILIYTATDAANNAATTTRTVIVLSTDSDNDGLPDAWELDNFDNLNSTDGTQDNDSDGLSNAEEFAANTNPMQADSDDDGSSDGEEMRYGSSPTEATDNWRTRRPMQPSVASLGTVLLRGQNLDSTNPFSDPDGDNLKQAQWQISRNSLFTALVFDRQVNGITAITLPLGVLEGETNYWVRTRHIDSTDLPSAWSAETEINTATQFAQDADGNGTDDRYQVDGFTDSNNNSINDADEGLCHLRDAEQDQTIGFQSSDGNLRCLSSHNKTELSAVAASGESLPYGLFTIVIDGLMSTPDTPASINLTLYLPEALPADHRWYNYDGVTDTFAVFSGAISANGKQITLILIDGGAGDLDGVTNGVIVDPLGVVFTETTASITEPTNNTRLGGGGSLVWLLGLLLMLRSVGAKPRRDKTRQTT